MNSWSDTQVVATVPVGALSGVVYVVTAGGGAKQPGEPHGGVPEHYQHQSHDGVAGRPGDHHGDKFRVRAGHGADGGLCQLVDLHGDQLERHAGGGHGAGRARCRGWSTLSLRRGAKQPGKPHVSSPNLTSLSPTTVAPGGAGHYHGDEFRVRTGHGVPE